MTGNYNWRTAIINTWGKHCTRLIFVIGTDNYNCNERKNLLKFVIGKHENKQFLEFLLFPFASSQEYLWGKLMLDMRIIFKWQTLEWLLKTNDNTYTFFENLKRMIEQHTEAYNYHELKFFSILKNANIDGGSGYLMNYIAANTLLQNMINRKPRPKLRKMFFSRNAILPGKVDFKTAGYPFLPMQFLFFKSALRFKKNFLTKWFDSSQTKVTIFSFNFQAIEKQYSKSRI